jgi:ketosteroid isomerase-like protein
MPKATTMNPSTPQIELLRAAYAAFNTRDIDAALLLMTPDVTWPRAFKGGFVRGPDEVRAYWTEQWSEIDPTVEPLAFHAEDAGQTIIVVEVHQVVRDLAGNVIADDRVGHRFTIARDLIAGMEVWPLPSASADTGAAAQSRPVAEANSSSSMPD